MADGTLTTVSAMVMLVSASGAAPDPRHPPTAATVGAQAPRPEALQRSQQSFRATGFEVGQAVGGTFAITGPAALFERVFGLALRPDGRGGVVVGDTATYEIPADHIPPSLRGDVAIVTFTPPPDFGPGRP
jgi:hypothetical protein